MPGPTTIGRPEVSIDRYLEFVPSEPIAIKPRVLVGIAIAFWTDNSNPSEENNNATGDSEDII